VTTFSVWKFDDPDGAIRAARVLDQTEAEGLLTVDDRAVVSWPVGEDQPFTQHGRAATAGADKAGTLCRGMVGALFTFPLVGGVVGGAIAALSRRSGAAITCADIKRILDDVVPGTSALFVVTDGGDLVALRRRLLGFEATLLETELSDVQRDRLVDSLGRS
jgi:uncharacterized membrane protein